MYGNNNKAGLLSMGMVLSPFIVFAIGHYIFGVYKSCKRNAS
jgi:hypothetical protein